jgi:hypothetical protein
MDLLQVGDELGTAALAEVKEIVGQGSYSVIMSVSFLPVGCYVLQVVVSPDPSSSCCDGRRHTPFCPLNRWWFRWLPQVTR